MPVPDPENPLNGLIGRAGERMLRLVVESLKANVRPYDVIVRSGGHSITFGLAEHEPGDGLEELISRADAGLLATRKSRGSS